MSQVDPVEPDEHVRRFWRRSLIYAVSYMVINAVWSLLSTRFPALRDINEFNKFEFLAYVTAVSFALLCFYGALFGRKSIVQRRVSLIAGSAFLCVPVYYGVPTFWRPTVVIVGAVLTVSLFTYGIATNKKSKVADGQ